MNAVRPELLARLPVGVPDAEVEREAGLPQGFLQRARHGAGGGPRATGSWLRLRAWLERPRGTAAPRVMAPSPAGPSLGDLLGPGELTLERLSGAVVRLAEMIARPDVDPARANMVLASLRELRPLLDRLEEQRARADAGRPIVVRVEYVNTWRRKLAELEALERGETA